MSSRAQRPYLQSFWMTLSLTTWGWSEVKVYWDMFSCCTRWLNIQTLVVKKGYMLKVWLIKPSTSMLSRWVGGGLISGHLKRSHQSSRWYCKWGSGWMLILGASWIKHESERIGSELTCPPPWWRALVIEWARDEARYLGGRPGGWMVGQVPGRSEHLVSL